VCLDPNATPEQQLLLGLHSSGSGAIYSLPMTKVPPKSTVPPRSSLQVLTSATIRTELISATFVPRKDGVLRLAFLVGGIKLLIEDTVCELSGLPSAELILH
jgi:hypothetical protein